MRKINKVLAIFVLIAVTYACDDILEEEGDAEQAPSELRQQDRIIEDREDTEGLF